VGKTLKKILKKKNIVFKYVNNHKTTNYHILFVINHNVSKGLERVYSNLAPIYAELENDFQTIDLIDLKFYERWLDV
jgi:hypothetical protein